MRTILRKIKEIVLLCGIIFSGAASAQCKFTTLTIPGATAVGAAGVNDNGAIVGSFSDSAGGHGFLLSGGKFFKFRFPGSFTTDANDINNLGQIVGDYLIGSPAQQHGFVVHNGVFHSISAPGPAGTGTRALGINNVGDIVGSVGFAGEHGFLLHNGHFTTIMFPGSGRTDAFGINGFGTIVGFYGDAAGIITHGFMLKAGKFTTIDFPGADGTSVFRIDNEGDIVGAYTMHGDVHGFALDKGKFTTLDDPNAGISSVVFDVNSHDRIVGNFLDVNFILHAFTATCPAGAVF